MLMLMKTMYKNHLKFQSKITEQYILKTLDFKISLVICLFAYQIFLFSLFTANIYALYHIK